MQDRSNVTWPLWIVGITVLNIYVASIQLDTAYFKGIASKGQTILILGAVCSSVNLACLFTIKKKRVWVPALIWFIVMLLITGAAYFISFLPTSKIGG